MGFIDSHGDVHSWRAEREPVPHPNPDDLNHDVRATFTLSPGGHLDWNLRNDITHREAWRLLLQAHPEIPQWQQHHATEHWGSKPEEPPHYRDRLGKKHCGDCKMFDKGHCWGYGNRPVGKDMVCDSFYPAASKADEFPAFKTAELLEQPTTHNLTWEPGGPGKGFVLNDGGVWTWPTENMRPMHMQKSYTVKTQGGQVKPGTAFHIEPEGRIWQYGEGRSLAPEDQLAIMGADPSLHFGEQTQPPGPVQTDDYGHADRLLNILRERSAHALWGEYTQGDEAYEAKAERPAWEAAPAAPAEVRLRSLHHRALSEGDPGDGEAEVDPRFPGVRDAIAVNQRVLQAEGNTNHALLRPDVLEGALGRAANHWHYTGSVPYAAAAIAHGVGQAQAFEDGNKRTAYHLAHGFLHDNGYGNAAPDDDEELADHLIGYGEGTHSLEDTAAMFQRRMTPRPFGSSARSAHDEMDVPELTTPGPNVQPDMLEADVNPHVRELLRLVRNNPANLTQTDAQDDPPDNVNVIPAGEPTGMPSESPSEPAGVQAHTYRPVPYDWAEESALEPWSEVRANRAQDVLEHGHNPLTDGQDCYHEFYQGHCVHCGVSESAQFPLNQRHWHHADPDMAPGSAVRGAALWRGQEKANRPLNSYAECECPDCGLLVHDTRPAGYEPVLNGQHGQPTWDCPGCGADWEDPRSRPREIATQRPQRVGHAIWHEAAQLDAQHRLWWQPGVPGRGLTHDDGRVTTWPESEASHYQMMSQFGPGQEFNIRPNGTVPTSDPAQYHAINGLPKLDPQFVSIPQRPGMMGFGATAGVFEPPESGGVSPRDNPFEQSDPRWQQWRAEADRWQWEQSGDLDNPHKQRTIGWVPTEHLRPMLEWDRNVDGDPERVQAVQQSLLSHGFTNPIWVDFNPNTNRAHISEGNHRLTAALAAQIPAVPVSVYRSSRVPSNPNILRSYQYVGGQADHLGNPRPPQYMHPRDIGMPEAEPWAPTVHGGPAEYQASHLASGPVEAQRHEMLPGGVSATFTVDDTNHQLTIEEWTSTNRGQGNTNLALAHLRSQYPGYAIVAFDATTTGAVPYWQHQQGKGLVDEVTDEGGAPLAAQAATWTGEPEAAPQLMYHVAPAEAYQSISEQGLSARKPGIGSPRVQRSGVYLFPNLEDALYWQKRWGHHHLWEVNVEGLNMRPDDRSDTYSVYSPESIPPERLTLHSPRTSAWSDETQPTMYHGTTRANAERIKANGFRGQQTFLTTHAPEAEGYGEHVLHVRPNLTNPLEVPEGAKTKDVIEQAGLPFFTTGGFLNHTLVQDLQARGHDGLLIHHPVDQRDPSYPLPARQVAIAFNPAGLEVVGEHPSPEWGWQNESKASGSLTQLDAEERETGEGCESPLTDYRPPHTARTPPRGSEPTNDTASYSSPEGSCRTVGRTLHDLPAPGHIATDSPSAAQWTELRGASYYSASWSEGSPEDLPGLGTPSEKLDNQSSHPGYIPALTCQVVSGSGQESQWEPGEEGTGLVAGPMSGETPREATRWLYGQCGTYALALMHMRPELRLGSAGNISPDIDGYLPDHFFAHDDTHAYDALGAHPLPYHGPTGEWPEQMLDLGNPSAWGIPQDELEPHEVDNALEAAQEHAARNNVLGLEEQGQPWGDHFEPRQGAQDESEAQPWYHLTDNENFALDPSHEPVRNTTIGGSPGPGIFLGRDPAAWFNGHDYVRPFVAEFDAPHLQPDKGMYRGEAFVPAERFHELNLRRVIPWDEHVRETYGEPGHFEEHHDHDALKLPAQPGDIMTRYPKFPDYRYQGPDVREMPPQEIQRLKDRTQQYIQAVRPHMLTRYDENGDPVKYGDPRWEHLAAESAKSKAGRAVWGEVFTPPRTPLHHHKFFVDHPGIDPDKGDRSWLHSLDRSYHYPALRDYQQKQADINVNPILRRGEWDHGVARDRNPDFVPALDSALALHPPIQVPSYLYRGSSMGTVARALGSEDPQDWVGRTFQDHGYTSTAVDPRQATAFVPHNGYLVHIEAPPGTPGAYLPDEDYQENEWLLPRGSQFQVLGAGDRRAETDSGGEWGYTPLYVRYAGADPTQGTRNWEYYRDHPGVMSSSNDRSRRFRWDEGDVVEVPAGGPEGSQEPRRSHGASESEGSLTFRRSLVPGGHGSDDYEPGEGEAYTLHALRDGQPIGSLDYELTPQAARIRWMEAHERRQGVGTALVNELQRLHPGVEITTGGFTPEGEAFWNRQSSSVGDAAFRTLHGPAIRQQVESVDPADPYDSYCYDAAEKVSEYLTERGIPHTFADMGTVRDRSHVYIILANGTILDPTLDQFYRGGRGNTTGDWTSPRWKDGLPGENPWAGDFALIPPDHPFAQHYNSHRDDGGSWQGAGDTPWTEPPQWWWEHRGPQPPRGPGEAVQSSHGSRASGQESPAGPVRDDRDPVDGVSLDASGADSSPERVRASMASRQREAWVDAGTRLAFPIRPEDLETHIHQHGPWGFRVEDTPEIRDAILAHPRGLLPWDDPENQTGSAYAGTPMEARPGHVYFSTRDRSWDPDWLRNMRGAGLAIDLRQLDPQRLNPDEDWLLGQKLFQGLPRPDYDAQNPLGQQAETMGLGDNPDHTREALQDMGAAYRGAIPPQALMPYSQWEQQHRQSRVIDWLELGWLEQPCGAEPPREHDGRRHGGVDPARGSHLSDSVDGQGQEGQAHENEQTSHDPAHPVHATRPMWVDLPHEQSSQSQRGSNNHLHAQWPRSPRGEGELPRHPREDSRGGAALRSSDAPRTASGAHRGAEDAVCGRHQLVHPGPPSAGLPGLRDDSPSRDSGRIIPSHRWGPLWA